MAEGSSSPSLLDLLLQRFCPPLDSALVAAIGADFSDEASAVEVLGPLAAEAEEAEVEKALEGWSLEEKEINDAETAASTDTAPTTGSAPSLNGEAVDEPSPQPAEEANNGKPEGSDPTLAFLVSLFPARPPIALRNALSACRPASDDPLGRPDVSLLVDQFLTEDYLASPEALAQLESPTAPPSAPCSPPGSPKSKHNKKQRRRRDQAAARGQQIVSLTDIMHSDLKRSLATATAATSPWGNVEPENKWVALDSRAAYVARLLGVAPGLVTSAYHKADSNLVVALDRLLDQIASSRSEQPNAANAGSPSPELVLLRETFPSRTDPDRLRLLKLTENDPAAAIDLAEFLDALAAQHGTPSWNLLVHRQGTALPAAGMPLNGTASAVAPPFVMVPDSGTSQGVTQVSAARHRAVATGWQAPSPVQGPPLSVGSSGLASASVTTTGPGHSSSAECYAIAEEYRVRRDTAYRSAASAFQSGRSTSGTAGVAKRGAAAYWADRGREMDAKSRLWGVRAARAKVEERRKVRDGVPRGGGGKADAGWGVVDLHGLTVNQALTVTREQVNAWWTSAPHPAPLRVITGAGKHSANSSPILLPAISKMLDREGWSWKYESVGSQGLRGAVIVTGVSIGCSRR